jgi:hypothetical protein
MMLETEELVQSFVDNPQLIGAFQEDVVILRPLEKITQGIRASQSGSESIFSGKVDRPMGSEKSTLSPSSFHLPPFHPFVLADRGWFEQLLQANGNDDYPLASYSFTYHFIWRELFTYEWARLGGHICLFATNQDGTFLALPPVGPEPSDVIDQVFDVLGKRNCGSGVSRIDNVPFSFAERCESCGYRVRATAGDYIYLREDLAGLKGNSYKSQRAAYNQCGKQAAPHVRSYREADLESCIRLFENWRAGIDPEEASTYARQVAEDAVFAHRVALRHATQLGLIGLVAEVSGRLDAYTFGFPITPSVFCIMLEISSRDVPGLSAFIFREFCRALESYHWINTMDDSGIAGLRRAKLAYRPIKIVKSYTVTPSRELDAPS